MKKQKDAEMARYLASAEMPAPTELKTAMAWAGHMVADMFDGWWEPTRECN